MYKSQFDWPKIRAEYEAGESFSALGRIHGCTKAAIIKRANREGWSQDAESVIRRKVAAKVSGFTESDTLHREEAISAEVDRRAEVITKHREEPAKVRHLLEEGVRLAESPDGADRKLSADLLKAAKLASETLTNLHRLERRAWGLDDGGITVDGAPAITINFE